VLGHHVQLETRDEPLFGDFSGWESESEGEGYEDSDEG
jgi:hypothetical protein